MPNALVSVATPSNLLMTDSTQMDLHIHACADAEAVAHYAADAVVITAASAIAERGVFHWVLAGGTTPKRCYELLRGADIDWSNVHAWFGDERCLLVGHAERNDRMADEALLSHVPIPSAQVHRIAAELGPEVAAARYGKLLAEAPVMDLILLGMGEDGHTASLFPDNPALNDPRPAIPVDNSPKPPPERVSMGYAALNAARRCLIMVAGKGKAGTISRILAGERLPVACVTGSEWVIDQAAYKA